METHLYKKGIHVLKKAPLILLKTSYFARIPSMVKENPLIYLSCQTRTEKVILNCLDAQNQTIRIFKKFSKTSSFLLI